MILQKTGSGQKLKNNVLFGVKEDRRGVIGEKLQDTGFAFRMEPLADVDLGLFDAVIPLTLADQDVLRRRRAAGETFRSLLPSAAAETLSNDKWALNQALIDAGFAAHIPPMTGRVPQDRADYPLVRKKRRDEWGKSTRIVQGPQDLAGFDPGSEFLQALVPGADEYATHILMRDGVICFDRTVHYIMHGPQLVKGKFADARETIWLKATPQLSLFRQMLAAIGFTDGICCIDYRLVDGMVQLFEINPRFGVSLSRRVDALLPAYLAALAAPQAQPSRAAR